MAPVRVLGADTSRSSAAAPEIEAGKLADLVVLDRNLFAIDANEISEAKVLLTLLGSKPVYGNWNDVGDRAGAKPKTRYR